MDLVVNSEFRKVYANKKVFLTGHTGFKGSWMLKWLSSLGAEIKGFALAPENTTDLYHLIDGDKLCDSIIANINDFEKLKKEIVDFKPDFVFHFAAQALVRQSYNDSLETFETNVMGTANVLEAIKYLKKECVCIFITTDKVYENIEKDYAYVENDKLGGYDPYSASKAAAEIIISSYRQSFFNPENFDVHLKSIASARAGNVIGGGDWSKDRLIPDIVKALQAKEKIELRNPNSVRPWQHVLEPLSGYLQLGLKLKENPKDYSRAWNFGPFTEDKLTVEEFTKTAIALFGYGDYFISKNINQPHEANLLQLDINDSISKLGWKPKWNSRVAVEKTINWYLGKQTIEEQLTSYCQ